MDNYYGNKNLFLMSPCLGKSFLRETKFKVDFSVDVGKILDQQINQVSLQTIVMIQWMIYSGCERA